MVNRMNVAKTVILITALFLSLCSCSSPKWNRIDQKNDDNSNGVLKQYLIEPGDSLEVRFFYYSELNDRVTVRPDGRIKLQLIPEVSAAGLTVKEFNAKLIQLYAGCIRYPEISVTMRSFAGQRIFVGGEVGSPQIISLINRLTTGSTKESRARFKAEQFLKLYAPIPKKEEDFLEIVSSIRQVNQLKRDINKLYERLDDLPISYRATFPFHEG